MDKGEEKEKKSKKGARPKGDLVKSKVVQALVTQAEWNIINEKRELTNTQSMSEFISAVLLSYESILKKPPKDIVKFRAELRSIGININQIARAVNSKANTFITTEELILTLKSLENTIKRMQVEIESHYK